MTVNAGDPTEAAEINEALNARVGTTTATAAGGTTSGTTELAGDQVTATVVNGRTYRLKWTIKYSGTVAADRFVIRIRTGSGTGGTELESVIFQVPTTAPSYTEVIETDWTAGATGSQVFTGTVARVSGTGTLTLTGISTARRSFIVDLATTA